MNLDPQNLPLNCENSLQIPEQDLAELLAFTLEAMQIQNDDDWWTSLGCSSGTAYDINIYSDRVYGSGETDGINATAYPLMTTTNGDTLTDTSRSYSLFFQWEPK